MGWNDRLPEDPFIPSDSYYEAQYAHEEWMRYIEMCATEEQQKLTSQNIDPATLAGKPLQEPPVRQPTLSRLWEKFFGQEKESHSESPRREEDAELPF